MDCDLYKIGLDRRRKSGNFKPLNYDREYLLVYEYCVTRWIQLAGDSSAHSKVHLKVSASGPKRCRDIFVSKSLTAQRPRGCIYCAVPYLHNPARAIIKLVAFTNRRHLMTNSYH